MDALKTVADLMVTDPKVIDPETRIEGAWKIMHSEQIRHIPICKEDRLVGLVTQKDLLVNSQNTSFLSLPVAEVMVFRVTTTTSDTSLSAAAREMLEKRISCLPVVQDDKLVGMLTDTDFLKLAVHYLESDEQELTSELKEALEEFENDHPELTMFVSRISDLLAKMGI